MENFTPTRGSLSDILANPKETFIVQTGWAHWIVGGLFVAFWTSLLLKKVWFVGAQEQLFEAIMAPIMLLALCLASAFVFGWLIEEMQRIVFKSKMFDWNDVWWTGLGFPIGVLIFLSVPTRYHSIICYTSGILVLISFLLYWLRAYRLKHKS